jgi:uncharacterized protein (DUF1501 family)
MVESRSQNDAEKVLQAGAISNTTTQEVVWTRRSRQATAAGCAPRIWPAAAQAGVKPGGKTLNPVQSQQEAGQTKPEGSRCQATTVGPRGLDTDGRLGHAPLGRKRQARSGNAPLGWRLDGRRSIFTV